MSGGSMDYFCDRVREVAWDIYESRSDAEDVATKRERQEQQWADDELRVVE